MGAIILLTWATSFESKGVGIYNYIHINFVTNQVTNRLRWRSRRGASSNLFIPSLSDSRHPHSPAGGAPSTAFSWLENANEIQGGPMSTNHHEASGFSNFSKQDGGIGFLRLRSQLFDPLHFHVPFQTAGLTKSPTIDVVWFSSPAALGPSEEAMGHLSDLVWVKIWFFDVDQRCRFTTWYTICTLCITLLFFFAT